MARELVKISGYEVGETRDFYMEDPPSGWLHEDGSVISKTAYARLYESIGDDHNIGGEGPDEFRLPDSRGLFPRATGINGTLQEAGGSPFIGPDVGNTQNDQMQKMTGSFRVQYGGVDVCVGVFTQGSVGSSATSGSSANANRYCLYDSSNSPDARASNTTGGETRPCNMGVLRCIKY